MMRFEIIKFLKEFGFTKFSYLGFSYLVDLIEGRLNGTYNRCLQESYKKISIKYNVSYRSVERAIRTMIKSNPSPEINQLTNKSVVEKIVILI